ncbi:hypothetical protein EB093_09615 [bacterium]|nr:hypothetical protein [bacterium]
MDPEGLVGQYYLLDQLDLVAPVGQYYLLDQLDQLDLVAPVGLVVHVPQHPQWSKNWLVLYLYYSLHLLQKKYHL